MAPSAEIGHPPIPKWGEGGGGYLEMSEAPALFELQVFASALASTWDTPRGLGISPAGFAA